LCITFHVKESDQSCGFFNHDSWTVCVSYLCDSCFWSTRIYHFRIVCRMSPN
jgi:hypothetical protein